MIHSKLLRIIAVSIGLLLSLGLAEAQNTFEFRKKIVASTDDAEERQTGGQIDITSSDIELVNDGTTVGDQTVGMRFTGLSIPKDATILSAYIQFYVDEVAWTASTSVNIFGEASNNAAAFSTSAFNITNRTKTTASVAWNSIPVWPTVNVAGLDQRTPDLKALINEVIARAGWTEGNAISFLINGTGRRNAHAFDGSSTMAPELVITYIPKRAPVVAFPVTKGGIWMYHDSGKNLGSNWVNANYIDTAWPFYFAKLGYGEGNEKTTLKYGPDPSNKFITSYFRKKFTVADSAAVDSLLFRILVDDGAVVYLNGKEVFRRNMPSGAISPATVATNSVYGSDESFYFEHRVGVKLRNGINVIAVEVHQSDPESTDLGFDMEIMPKKPAMAIINFPVPKNSEWYYNDKGVNLYGTKWTDSAYAQETLWDYGKGALGYGDPMTTVLGYGPDANNKYVTYYFRKKIMISDLSKINADSIQFNVRRDDGAVVFINGVEVFRQNMPAGPLNHRSISSTITDGANETTYFTTNIAKSLFRNGINQVAVAMHQRDSISSDLGFDMEIVPKLRANPVAMGCVDGENHIACFTSITPTAQTTKMIYPAASHNFQQLALLKQGAAYTQHSGTIPTNHDFTAYIPRNGSSTNGVLSVNHENSPGGVSLAYVRYIDTTQLWVVDSTKRVDFTNVVTTIRNCSGGVTPWGTVITSEESTSTADVNADGYLDIGWNVEIDPWTGKIKEYGNGKQEKLWSLGRMNHENVVISKDSVTVYQGEDGGTHMVYKFVADKKMDLSKGKLYVLKLNSPLVGGESAGTTGKWIRVPNTTQSDNNNCASLAAAVGGTAFNGVEDVEISTVDGKVYFTAKGLNKTYRFKDGDTTFTQFETFVGGKSYYINNGTNNILEAWGSGNDNLTIDDKGNVWVLQDGSRNYIWMVRPDHTQSEPKVELFMSPTAGAEPTGMTFTPDYKFMFLSIQHPSSSNVAQVDASGNSVDFKVAATIVMARKEYLGVPVPKVAFKVDTTRIRAGKTVKFEDLSMPLVSGRTWEFKGAVTTTSTLKNVTVQYNDTGLFNVKLKAFNKTGVDSLEKLAYIQVIPELPQVKFTANKLTVYEGDTITFTDQSTGVVWNREWLFSGGHIAKSTKNIEKVIFKTMGVYNVSLSAGNYGDTSYLLKTNYITILRRAPIARFTSDKTVIFKGGSVKLIDQSQNRVESRKWTAVGAVLNGAAGDSVLSVTYNKKGKYAIKLWVSNAGGKDSLLKTDYITVNPLQPIVDFAGNKITVFTGDTVTFSDLSRNDIDTRKWTITGGTLIGNASDSVIRVKYPNKGTFPVKLFVKNISGADSMTKLSYIRVEPSKPVADFTVDKTSIKQGNSVVFTDMSTGEISSRSWTFTGATPSTGSDVSEAVYYANPGIYDVQLSVSNASGTHTKLKTAYIKVASNTNIEKLEEVADFTIFPNPVRNFVNLNMNLYNAGKVEIEITDISGKVIGTLFADELTEGKHELKLDISELNLGAGAYFINIRIGEQTVTKKIMKS